MNNFFRAVSIVFQPLIMPTLGLWLYLTSSWPSVLFMSDSLKWFLILSSVLLTFLIPLSLILLMMRMGYVKTLMMNDRNERMIPMVITLASYVVFYILMKRFSMVQGMGIVFLYFISAFISVSIALLVTRFWKISLHAIGVGGLAAFTTIQLLVFDSIGIAVSVLIFTIAGLTGTSRIYLNAHTPLQVWIGYLVGILPQAALLLWMI